MSTEITEGSQRFALTASELLKKYSAKLDAMRSQAISVRDEFDYYVSENNLSQNGISQDRHAWRLLEILRASRHKFKQMEPALTRFARQVSQHLEHSEQDDISSMELQLRLAEFEASVNGTRAILTQLLTF